MSRDLTEREAAVLAAMIERATPFDPEPGLDDAERRAWLALVPGIRAWEHCGCGTCPSIELQPGGEGRGTGPRIVLQASAPEGLLLLFVSDGRPSYLELAPGGHAPVAEFPPVERIHFEG